MDIAKSEGMSRLNAVLTADNGTMITIIEKLGFSIQLTENEKLLVAIIEL